VLSYCIIYEQEGKSLASDTGQFTTQTLMMEAVETCETLVFSSKLTRAGHTSKCLHMMMDLAGIAWGGMYWINLAQDTSRVRDPMR
jgi:hypothetical protein